MKKDLLAAVLGKHVFVTVGCTDPVAIALAASRAYREVPGRVRSVTVTMDRNIYKDAFSVGIPGVLESGMDLAVALGILYGEPEKGLRLLEGVEPSHLGPAREFLKECPILFKVAEDVKGIYVLAEVETDAGSARALLRHAHDGLVEVTRNGERVFSLPEEAGPGGDGLLEEIGSLTLEDMAGLVREASLEELLFLKEGVRMNREAARAGESAPLGLGLGRRLAELRDSGLLCDDIENDVRQKVAAAADARMSGLNVPIYGIFGSGNHGITFFLTVGTVAEHLGSTDEELVRALALGLLVVGLIKSNTGILTPHCGCSVAAGAGAAAAIVRLYGGTVGEMEAAVHLLLADITGMLCDGAKFGCSLKMATSSGVAFQSALLAMKGAAVPEKNGLVGKTLAETMRNLRIITDPGMAGVDRAVLEILTGGEDQGDC
ncbi:MAG: L-serine ammonia-lyase, iron-sulfur-dependent, subunit alpha [Thermovirgaceae bacterium]|nr:L-serine ammonia-lyase, iron-sulfur-dependent, subunit alpha [Synergistales bacterium]HPC76461.1 L-serine ammonia-lyase, iron-sulfur-dependent, subunit alpha [Synergistales bacterium]HRS48929.1 L-serine ammonia-lyase, iron-sulfur-dependent, subunit alpha [Thermovirgaceae bacterium]HRU91250.1 L-serine ammonia-lyase, iron-sulfur-dependent, subunit alpha [Thermovirgaceae bacterium]